MRPKKAPFPANLRNGTYFTRPPPPRLHLWIFFLPKNQQITYGVVRDGVGRHDLSGMFRHSASLAIPHRKSFAAIPSVSLVLLGHTNRSVFLSHESQREIALF